MPTARPLQTVLAELPVSSGVDTKTNAKIVAQAKLLELYDARFNETGALNKRHGHDALATDVMGEAAIASGQALGRFRDELLLFDAGRLFSFATGIAKWVNRGGTTPFAARANIVSAQRTSASNPDSATLDGVTVFAWVDDGGARATVVDEDTGTVFLSAAVLSATGKRPKCVAIGDYLFVLYFEGTDLKARRVLAAEPSAFSAAFAVAVDVEPTAAQAHLDVIPFRPAGAPQPAALFVYTSGAGTTITVGYLLQSGLVGDPGNGFPSPTAIASTAEQALTIIGEADAGSWGAALVIWANATGLRGTSVQPDLAVGATVLMDAETDVVNVTATTALPMVDEIQVFYEVDAVSDTEHEVWWLESDEDGNAGAPEILRRSVGLAGKAFEHASGFFVPVVYAGSLQSTFFVIDSLGDVQGRLLSGNAGGLQDGALSSMVELDDDNFFWAAPFKSRLVSENRVTYSEIGVAKSSLTFDDPGTYRGLQAGDSFLIPGAIVNHYDGHEVVEAGFPVFPEGVSGLVQAAVGGLMEGDGQYAFTWIYEWYDAKGQIHRSAPAVPEVVIVPAGTDTNLVTHDVPTLRLSQKTGVRIIGFSTEKNGTIFYRTGHEAGSAVAGVENDPAVDSVTYTRTIADASIIANEVLYSQGIAGPDSGELSNTSPPSARLIAVGKRRAVIAGLENPLEFRYTKLMTPGVAPGFSDYLQGQVNQDGGDITAVALLDDKIVLFKRDSIYVVTGDGPDNTGQADSFTEPTLVTTDVGCIEPRSLAVVPDGLVFQSAKGIYVLTRALDAGYIGADVEGFNGQTITDATLCDDVNEVRFLTDDGLTLVYDYHARQWVTWRNHEGEDAVIFDGIYHYLRTDGTVFAEQSVEGEPNFDKDNGVDIHMKGRLAWLRPAGLVQGFQRIRRIGVLGDLKDIAHRFRGRVYYDYEPFFDEEFIFDPADALELEEWGGEAEWGDGEWGGDVGATAVYQLRHHLRRQKCQAISLEFEDIGSSPGAAFSISAIALEFAALPGMARLPATKTV